MKNVMIDIETMSTQKGAAIATIGAIRFDRFVPPPESIDDMETFYRRVCLESCKELKLHFDAKTVEWWTQQDADASYEVFCSDDRVHIRQALLELVEWLGNCDYTFLWAQGCTFDFPILENSFSKCKMDVPWRFWNVRDSRTLLDVARVSLKDIPSNGTHHALHDCYKQIKGVVQSFLKIKL
jgi:hypothetical protein